MKSFSIKPVRTTGQQSIDFCLDSSSGLFSRSDYFNTKMSALFTGVLNLEVL